MTSRALLRRRSATTFEPTPQAAGPWHSDLLFGGVPAAIAVHEVERLVGDSHWLAARITTDLVRPAPRALLSVDARVIREGSRIVVAEASVNAADGVVSRSSLLLVRDGAGSTSEPLAAFDRDTPADHEPTPMPLPHASIFDVMEMRAGRLQDANQRGWVRLNASLVEGEPLSALARTAVVADLAAGMTNTQGEVVSFINADLSLYLERVPAGDWLRIDVETRRHEGSVVVAGAALSDEDGPAGRTMMTSVRAAEAVSVRAAG